MNQELLNEAGSLLKFVAVYMKQGHVFFHEDMELPEHPLDFKIQSFKGVKSYTLKELDSDGKVAYLYDFEYCVGLRAADLSFDEDSEEFLKAEIIATYSVRYESERKLRAECVDEFLLHNVGYHVWPFWREHVQTSCLRAGVGLLSVPLYTDFQKGIADNSSNR